MSLNITETQTRGETSSKRSGGASSGVTIKIVIDRIPLRACRACKSLLFYPFFFLEPETRRGVPNINDPRPRLGDSR